MDERKEWVVEIGKRLTEARGIRTRRGVAKAIGISDSRLCNYEHGLRVPPDDIKVRIAEYYGVPVEDLFYANINYEA